MELRLTPNQLQQLKALADAEAYRLSRAKGRTRLSYFNENALGVLQAMGLVGFLSDHIARGGQRTPPSWWITRPGLERLIAEEAGHG